MSNIPQLSWKLGVACWWNDCGHELNDDGFIQDIHCKITKLNPFLTTYPEIASLSALKASHAGIFMDFIALYYTK